jgi:hypothetical protein
VLSAKSIADKKVINADEGDDIAMNRQEDDESYENDKDAPPRRTQRTKLKQFDDYGEVTASRNKRSSKRSHRRKTDKDDVWPDADD